MKYTLRHILDTRYDINRTKERKLAERFIPLNVLVKLLSPYTTWFFLNMGFRADHVTFLSLLVILIGSALFIVGYPIYGAAAFIVFGLLDSTDGDMARSTKPTSYGGVLDSFGADLFYACAPVSIAYYLMIQQVGLGLISPSVIMLVGAFTSLTFLFYRLLNAKIYKFTASQTNQSTDPTVAAKEAMKSGLLKKLLKLYRHPLLRGNFFSEAGMIFWFFVLVLFGSDKYLAGYLLIILLYNIGYLATNFVGMYVLFLKHEKSLIKSNF